MYSQAQSRASLKGAVNAEVTLALEGGEAVVAVITNSSVDSLGLDQASLPMPSLRHRKS